MYFTAYKSGYLLYIKLSPNASACGFGGVFAVDGIEYLKAYVNVVPEKGKANQALIKMLSKQLKLPKSVFSIVSGITDHYKKIQIETQEDISAELLKLDKED